MGRAEQGDPLTTGLGILQPGWTVENDGYGLLTCKADFIRNNDGPISASSIRNVTFPGDSRLKMHKFSVSHISLNRLKITVDSIGIDSTQPGGSSIWTMPQVSGSNGLSTEKIETHPNFFVNPDYWVNSSPIAGNGPYTQSNKGPIITKSDKTNDRSYIGLNGACFERADGGRFIGFVDKTYPRLYGKSSYLAPTTIWSGIVYTSEPGKVADFKDRVGQSFASNDLGDTNAPNFLATAYATVWTASDGSWQLLVTKADTENFGHLYKISYEIRFNKEGFDDLVYNYGGGY